jgi:hypothetical protein
MTLAKARGAALNAMVAVVNHDVDTPPAEMLRRRIEAADAAVASARAKVDKLTRFVRDAPKGSRTKQQAHLTAAKKALAEAIAYKEGIV